MDTQTSSDGTQTLRNMRWEAFCQLYSGACFGNASKAYKDAGYKPKTDKAAAAEASRMLIIDNVSKRIKHLRKLRGEELAIDQTRLMELRLKIIYNADSSDSDKLRAMDSIEKALGLAQPVKLEHSMAEGAVIKFVNE